MAAGSRWRRSASRSSRRAFDAEVRRHLDARRPGRACWRATASCGAGEFSLAQAEELREAGPWGQHFPEPLFDGEFWLRSQRLLGGKHLKLVVSPMAAPQLELDAIAFNIDAAHWPDAAAASARDSPTASTSTSTAATATCSCWSRNCRSRRSRWRCHAAPERTLAARLLAGADHGGAVGRGSAGDDAVDRAPGCSHDQLVPLCLLGPVPARVLRRARAPAVAAQRRAHRRLAVRARGAHADRQLRALRAEPAFHRRPRGADRGAAGTGTG